MTSRYRGALAAPEWPAGLDWLNTARPLSLPELRGKIVLLEFWTSNCVNCRQNSAALARLRSAFPHETVVIGVHSSPGMTRESLRQAVMRADLLYPVVDDPQRNLAKLYNVTAWPTVTLIDPLGGYVLQEAGPIDAEKYRGIVKTMVADYDKAGVLERKPLVAPALPAVVSPEELREPQRVLKFPSRLLVLGQRLYLADTGHHRIVEIQLDADGLGGEVLRVFGEGLAERRDGAAGEAAFAGPRGLASDGQRLFVADTDNHSVRSIELSTGQVSTLVSPQSGPLSPRSPWALALHGDLLFIAMAGFHQVWVLIEPGQSNQVGPFMGNGLSGRGDGSPVEATFNQPRDLALAGPSLVVADTFNHALRRITWEGAPRTESLSSGEEGDADGPLGQARLRQPGGLAVGPDGRVAVSDTGNHKLKLISQGQLTTLAGGEPGLVDGPLAAARFHEPDGLAWSGPLLYVADTNNHAVRVVDTAQGSVSTLRLRALERLANVPHRERPARALERQTIAGGPTLLRLDLQLPPGYRRHPEVSLTLRVEWYGTVQRFRFGPEQTPEAVLTLMHDGPLYLEFSVYYSKDDKAAPCYVQHANLLVPVKVDPNGSTELKLPYRVYLELE